MIITGWPFRIEVVGGFEGGAGATISIELAPAEDDALSVGIGYAVETFVELAAAGGLGGDRIAPSKSTSSPAVVRPVVHPSRRDWDIEALSIDARSLAVLFNLLGRLSAGVKSLSISGAGTGPLPGFEPTTMPPAWPTVPFSLDDDRTGPNVGLTVEFVRSPGKQKKAVLSALQLWLDTGVVQGYRDWSEPAEALLAPTDWPAFVVEGSTVSASIDDSGALEGAYDVLINVLIRLHDIAPIEEVSVL